MRFSNPRQFPDTLAPLAGVLLKRAPLSQAARAERLLDEAKRRTRLLVRDAERDVDASRTRAATAGYEAGFARAIAEVVDCLERINVQRTTLLERVVDDVRHSLEGLLDDPDLLLRIVDALESRRVCAVDRPLRVLVPARAARIAPAIRERLSNAYPSVQIVLADTRSFVVESDEDIFEFDPRDVARELSEAALAACRAAARTDDDTLAQRAVIDALRRFEQRDAAATDDAPVSTLASTGQEPCNDALASHDPRAN
ncbi:type III secretion system protein [Burkholderia mayonis]|uniref:Type III secretion system protein n=1 Tax=Burkholderia mayonis TaxID=1385591 RepID=A0A1B4G222_9BURK|nr:type III secretion system protein [Burkholderia mayonis]AOJ09963.1 type III secretion system protein [Burkholderia mayonis]KVE58684.1 type III secretion system protein [Burkholderia mayonis]